MKPDELQRFHSGDEGVFDALIKAHSPQLLAAAISLTRDRAGAHELVHDAWVHAFTRRASFRGTGSFVGWMLAILHSCHHLQYRAQERQAARGDVYAREQGTSDDPRSRIEAELDRSRMQQRLLGGLAALTERQRDVVTMRVIEGRSVTYTAERLGIAEGTVKATLSQALKRLRAIINERDA